MHQLMHDILFSPLPLTAWQLLFLVGFACFVTWLVVTMWQMDKVDAAWRPATAPPPLRDVLCALRGLYSAHSVLLWRHHATRHTGHRAPMCEASKRAYRVLRAYGMQPSTQQPPKPAPAEPAEEEPAEEEDMAEALRGWVLTQRAPFMLRTALIEGAKIDESKITSTVARRGAFALKALGCRRYVKRDDPNRYWYDAPEAETAEEATTVVHLPRRAAS
jgi:hypothetical protein